MGDHADDARDYEERMRFNVTPTRDYYDPETSFRYDANYFPANHPVVVEPSFAGAQFHKYTCAVVGLPYRNDDGSNRQVIAAELESKAVLWLRREPSNPYDPNAVEVWAAMWEGKVGYLPKGLAAYYAPIMDAGAQVMAVLEEKHMSRKPGKEHVIGGLTVRTGVLGKRLPDSGDSPVVA